MSFSCFYCFILLTLVSLVHFHCILISDNEEMHVFASCTEFLLLVDRPVDTGGQGGNAPQ